MFKASSEPRRRLSVHDEVLSAVQEFDGGVELTGVCCRLDDHVEHDDANGEEIDALDFPPLTSAIGVRHGDDLEVVDPVKVRGVAGVDGKAPRYGDGCGHGVVGASSRFAARTSQRRGDLAEAAGCGSIERDGFEIGLGLL